MGEQAYESLHNRFPNLDQFKEAIDYQGLHGMGKCYWRGDMLQALWRIAGEEEAKAGTLIGGMKRASPYRDRAGARSAWYAGLYALHSVLRCGRHRDRLETSGAIPR